jgi:hypothetical protein
LGKLLDLLEIWLPQGEDDIVCLTNLLEMLNQEVHVYITQGQLAVPQVKGLQCPGRWLNTLSSWTPNPSNSPEEKKLVSGEGFAEDTEEVYTSQPLTSNPSFSLFCSPSAPLWPLGQIL